MRLICARTARLVKRANARSAGATIGAMSLAAHAPAFAPTGCLRAAINVGNPVLARAVAGGAPQGVAPDLAARLAQALGLEWEPVVFDTAAKAVDAVAQGSADVGFFAVDPGRGAAIAFTEPYLLIEGAYLVPENSAIRAPDEVDRAGVRVAVGQGSAYDLFLSRELKAATIVRAPSSPAVVEHGLREGVEVIAGVKQQIEAEALRLGGLRMLPGRFMLIRQAMGLPKARGEAAHAALAAFVEAAKADGFVAAALARHGVEGVSVAPAAG
jgi:polar amino acid transport system substrate-binding protein